MVVVAETMDQVTEPQPETVVPKNPFAHLTDPSAAKPAPASPEQVAEGEVLYARMAARKQAREKAQREKEENPFAGLIAALKSQPEQVTQPVNPFANLTPKRIAEVTAQSARK